ncbi:MAG: DUF3592 domain-containing protein [Candidatus Obscuribacterales bacterium]|nr:DUF3592 domain-containing protein [Candidatus Obscuribacterales bacterium]
MASILLLTTQFLYIDKAVKSRSWTRVEARVVSVEEAEKRGAKFDKVDDALRDVMLPAMFSLPRIGFAFDHDAITYRSTNYSFSIDPLGPSTEEVLEEYPLGARIDAYFDPSDPTNSVVKPGLNEHFYMIVASSVVLIGISLFWITSPIRENMLS